MAICYYTAMACPYFDPGEPLPGLKGSLGDLYGGLCRVNEQDARQPDERTLAGRCNLGYARGQCLRFPENGGPDAVRFSVTRDKRGIVRILYASERDHRPFANGALEFSTEAGAFTGPPPDAPLARLASAYIRSYLRRTR